MDSVKARNMPDTKHRRICMRTRRDLIHGKQNRKCLGGRRSLLLLLPRDPSVRLPRDDDDDPSVPRLLSRRARLSLRLSSSRDR